MSLDLVGARFRRHVPQISYLISFPVSGDVYLSRNFAKSSSMPVRNSMAADRFLVASAFSSSTGN